MIKRLKSSDKTVRPFTTFKNWRHSTIDSLGSLLLEQDVYNIKDSEGNTKYVSKTCNEINDILKNEYGGLDDFDYCRGDELPRRIGITIESVPDNDVLYENGILASPEEIELNNSDGFSIRRRDGCMISGTFYPRDHTKFDAEKEPINWDGSYQRVVYNNIKHLFYNDYFVEHYDYTNKKKLNIKNPLMLFGVESAEYHDPSVIEDIDQGGEYTQRRIERRVIGDKISVIEISQKNFGEKIKPGSFNIKDNSSPYDTIHIKDDGYTNLITTGYTFSEIEKVEFDENLCGVTSDNLSSSGFTFGHDLASHGNYFISGAPANVGGLDESQSGVAFLFKKDSDLNKFRCIRKFECPFTQNGLALEQRQDHNDILMRELSGLVLGNDYSLNDNFGSAVELTDTTCVIGASRSHIRGTASELRTGHVFIYEKDKGGVDNWGLLNIIEGVPDTDFGHSVSIHNDTMAIGAPKAGNGSGVVYIFKKKQREKCSPWLRLTDVPEGYMYDVEKNKRMGYPVGDKLKDINQYTTRWKVKSLIPDGAPLGCFHQSGEMYTGDVCVSGSFPSGSLISGSLISGSLISGSLISGSLISGNILSGNLISGCDVETILMPGAELPISEDTVEFKTLDPNQFKNCVSGTDLFVSGSACVCDLYTFADDKILVEATIEDPIKDFDAGYEPQKYNESPNFSVGDSTWELVDVVYGDENQVCENFGEEVKVYENRLYVGTPSSKNQIVYVYEYNQSDCPTEWSVLNKITRDYIWNSRTNLTKNHQGFSRADLVLYPYEYINPDRNNFGCSIDVNEQFLVIGDSMDRIYKNDLATNMGGSVFVFNNGDEIDFGYVTYSLKDAEEDETFRFGQSVALFNNNLVVGSHSLDTSNISYDENGDLIVDDFYFGTENYDQDYIYFGDERKSIVQGKSHYYVLKTDSYELLKTVKSVKERLSVRRQYGYSVTISSEFIYVGAPVLGTFPSYEITTFGDDDLIVDKSKSLFAHYSNIGENTTNYPPLKNTQSVVGLVMAYNTRTISESEIKQVGNIFYKNGVIVLTNLDSGYMKDFMTKSGQSGYEIYFKGVHTLFETEIVCKVEPNEFNMSTNPTSLIRDKIPYDINGDGKFDILDMILIFRFLTEYDITPEDVKKQNDAELEGGVAVEQDSMWPNSDILITESEDAILKFFTSESANINQDEYSVYLPYLRKLKESGAFDVNKDGYSDSLDAKLIVRYFRGNTGVDLIRGLITKYAERRVANEIVEFLDVQTGKNNGIKVLKDFEKFTDLNKLIKNGKNLDSLRPHATTIGLYDGLSLVAVAKLGKPIKITDSYPINFLVKYDG